jgi:hypoxanthine phosphoribosyltransferase
MDGSLFFVADLLRHLDIPIQLHTLTVSSYHGGTTSSGRLQLAQKLPFDLKTPHVLLIDDILDTGLTLASVRDRLIDEFQPEILRTVVLLNKEARRKADIHADYVGFEIEDQFVVGYGMDYQGHYRHLPCIGILNPDHLK